MSSNPNQFRHTTDTHKQSPEHKMQDNKPGQPGQPGQRNETKHDMDKTRSQTGKPGDRHTSDNH